MMKIFYFIRIAACLMAMLFAGHCARSQYINTYAGHGASGYSGDNGPALSASCSGPREVDVDKQGNVYIADAGNNVIRKVNRSTNVITTVAGNGTAGYSGDGGAAISAKLNKPSWVSVDDAGNLYIADISNYVVRKVNTSGIISTIAGTGTTGYSGDGGSATAAQLYWPFAVIPDNSGNIYISDFYNNSVRKINSSGIISTVAGSPVGQSGYSGDGGMADTARLYGPAGIALDRSNNLFIADYYNGVVRKVSSSGLITTYAGNGLFTFAGDSSLATAASMNGPLAVAADTAGNLFISDPGNSRIRYVAKATGIIYSIAGNGNIGYSGDGAHSDSADLSNPAGLKVDQYGNIFFADQNNNVIRVVSKTDYSLGVAASPVASMNDLKLFPNPNNGEFVVRGVSAALAGSDITLEITDMLGRIIYSNRVTAPNGNFDQRIVLDANTTKGVYLLNVRSEAGRSIFRLVVQ